MREPRQQPPLDQCLVLEIDGPGVHPDTADVPVVLELAAAMFQLIVANANESGGLKLTNIEIRDKCMAFVAVPDRLALAKASAKAAVDQISGGDIPKGCVKYVDRARSAVKHLPADQRVKILAGKWQGSVVVERRQPEQPMHEVLAIRAIPIRVGGTHPVVRFGSELDGEFTLGVTQQQARDIGPYLYREIDIDASIERDSDGTIIGGQLNSFDGLSESDPRPAWRDWFRSVGGDELLVDDRYGYTQ